MSDLKSLVEPVTRGDPMHRRANLMPLLRQRCHEVTTRLARNAAPILESEGSLIAFSADPSGLSSMTKTSMEPPAAEARWISLRSVRLAGET